MRFGLGWRPELGAGIVAHLDRIDVLEVLAEDFVDATRDQQRALRFLKSQVPLVVHGTSLGLASTERVDRKRLDDLARVVGWLEPELWSEHLAFVRGGGTEVGHLAAPPRMRPRWKVSCATSMSAPRDRLAAAARERGLADRAAADRVR